MNALLRYTAALSVLCLSTSAHGDPSTYPGTPATDQLAGLCLFESISEICGYPMTDKQRQSLEVERARIMTDNSGEEVTAAVLCSKLNDEAKSKVEHFCSPALKDYFYRSLDAPPE